jgi:hypothetical protein
MKEDDLEEDSLKQGSKDRMEQAKSHDTSWRMIFLSQLECVSILSKYKSLVMYYQILIVSIRSLSDPYCEYQVIVIIFKLLQNYLLRSTGGFP